jgi:pimeloyl-ACP methyl ester carboxylesterase
VFVGDVPAATAAVMAASQRPLSLAAGIGKTNEAAWKTIPSWYMVATEDHAIPPDAERFMARRAGSRTVEVAGSHG